MGLAAKKVSSKKRGSIKNTSVRKRTQLDLSKEYQVVFEKTGKAMVIVEEDATISLVNAEFEKLSGYTKEEIEGKKYWTEFVARDDRKRVKEYHLLRRTDPILAPRCFEFRFLDRQEKVKNIILTIGQIPGTNRSMASLLDVTDRRLTEETLQRDKKTLEDRVDSQTVELVKTNEALQTEIADLKREMELLRRNEEHNRMLIDNIDLSINLIDSDYTIVKANAAASKQTNKPVHELIGKKCFREFEKRDAVCPHCPGVQTMATGKLTEVEAEGVRDDGSHYKVRVQTFPVFGHNNTITGFIEIVEDISERKRMEDDLQETEERFRTLVETMKVGLSAIDAKGVHTYINEHLSEMLGYSANEIMGHPVIDFLDDENRKIYKKQLSRLKKGERESFEITWTRKDGRGVPTILAPTPILDAEGRYKGMYGFITDITERKRAEELLRKEKETLFTILQNAPYGVVLLDRDGKHLFVNPTFTAITGYTLEDIPTRKDWTHKAYPDKAYRQKVAEFWRKDSKLEKRVLSVVCKNGETKEIEFKPTILEDGRFVVMLEDITERKQMVEALRASEQHYRTLFEESLDGICLADAETGIIIDCNKAMADMVSRERAEFIGKSQTILHPPQDDQKKFSPTFKQHLTDKEGQIIETQIITRTGDIREVEIKANATNFQGKKLLQGVFRDITERKQAEKLLLQEKDTFLTILQNALYGVALMEQDGKHVYVNPEFTAITGYTLEDIPNGKDWMRKAYPDKAYRQKVTKLWRKDSKLGGTKRVVSINCKNGETKEIETSRTPLENGLSVAMLADITERKRAEEKLHRAYDELKDSEERYRTLIDNIDLGINLIDADHNIVMVNTAASKEINKPVSELIGKKCFQEFEKRDAVCPNCPGIQTMATGKLAEVETEGVRDDGSHFTVRIQTYPVFGHVGTVKEFIEIVEDITERKQMEDALRESEKRFKTLAERAPLGISIMAPDRSFEYLNPRFTEIFGYTTEDIPDKDTWFEKAYPDKAYRKKVISLWKRDVAEKGRTGDKDPRVFTVRCKNGQDKIIDFRSVDLIDGKQYQVYEDITARARAEEALRESEERYRTLAENVKFGLNLIDADYNIVMVNETLAKSLKKTASGLIGKKCFRSFEQRDAVCPHCPGSQAIATGKPAEFETEGVGDNHRRFYTRLKAFPILGQDGKATGFIEVVEDITERKQMEEELQQSQQELQALMDASPVAISWADLEGNIQYINHKHHELFGYTLEEIPTIAAWTRQADHDPAQRKRFAHWGEELIEAHRQGRSLPPREMTVTCKDGSIRYVTVEGTIVSNHNVVIYNDITERKHMEEALRTSRMHLADAMDMASIVYWETDHQAKEFMLNDAFFALYGTTVEAEGGYRMPFEKFIRRFIHPDDEAIFGQVNEDIEKSTDQEQTLYHEHRFIHWNGEIRYVGVRSRVFRDASGNIIRTFGANQDITERKKAEDQLKRYAAELEQSNEEVRNFAYIVSHDLRVPLVNLKGYSAELRSALEVIGSNFDAALPHLNDEKRPAVAMALHEDAPEALEFITNSVSRMDSFINSVLILSRLGRRELKPEPLDMNALVQTSLETLSHQIQERGTTVTIGSLPQVVADRTAMEQIIGNILGNAIKYLDPERPGQIEVTAETNNGEQIFRIRDNGRGIAEEDMHKVFAPFRRAGKQDTQGEGMGLAYVQTLVRRQEGRIWCESELGKGTTFTFTISHLRAEGKVHDAH